VAPSSSDAVVEIDLDAGPESLVEACAVMWEAFAEYSDRAQPSGALLESPQTLARECRGGTRVAVARRAGQMVAMVKYKGAEDGYTYFSRLSVVPSARHHGIGGRLVRALRAQTRAEGMRGLSCSVRAAEARNIAVYERLGMRVIGHEDRVSLTGAVFRVALMTDA
jgi:ribosomal protein S18 acetylase RimI-like enzyme